MFTEQLFFPEVLGLKKIFIRSSQRQGFLKPDAVRNFERSGTLWSSGPDLFIDNMRNSKLNKCLRFMFVRKKK